MTVIFPPEKIPRHMIILTLPTRSSNTTPQRLAILSDDNLKGWHKESGRSIRMGPYGTQKNIYVRD